MRSAVVWLGLVVLMALVAPANAADLLVTSTADDGTPGTLRAAIQSANAMADSDHITLPTGTILLTAALPAVTGPVTIEGAGSASVVQAPGTFRVFTINLGAQQVTLKALKITGGKAAMGGGVFTRSPLLLDTATVSGNTASAPSGGMGGGVATQDAPLGVNRSRITGNTADDAGSLGASAPAGGGVYAAGAVTINRSTLDANTATATAGTAQGGGLAAAPNTAVQMMTSTATDNRATTTSGNSSTSGAGLALSGGSIQDSTITDRILNSGSAVSLRSNIIGALGSNCSGTLTSQGFNVVLSGSGCPSGGSGDRAVDFVQLGPLADNGGPTPTLMPPSTSPAVDGGNGSDPTDQREQQRPYDNPLIPNSAGGNGSDSGAVERRDDLPPRTIVVTSNADAGPGTLRQAMIDANATSAEDTIDIPAMTINLQRRLPEITEPLLIRGAGASATVVRRDDAIELLQLFYVQSSTRFESLTIANGRWQGRGGAIYAEQSGTLTLDRVVMSNNTVAGSSLNDGGGALSTSGGALTIVRSRFTGNEVTRRTGISTLVGGAIRASNAAVTVERSTFDANSVGPAASMSGGAIAVLSGSMEMSRSTVSGNSATGRGGGIYVSTEVDVDGSTIAGNAAPTGANVANAGGTAPLGFVSLSGSIVAEPRGGGNNCAGGGKTSDVNLTDDTSCGAAGITADPQLQPLADNGGPTPTRAILGTSPAVDQSYDTETDQRGLPRPVDNPDRPNYVNVGNGADLGAYEVQDVTAPDTQLLTTPGALVASHDATFTFASTENGATFSCAFGGADPSPCASPATFHNIADGSHTFTVGAVDAAGNRDLSPASYTWSVDTTGPDTAVQGGPPALTNATTAVFSFTSPENGASFECRLDSADFTACSDPVQLAGLGDGQHTFEVRALDGLGNPDATPASRTWTVDLVAPSTAIDLGPPSVTSSTDAQFTFLSNDSDVTFRCKLDAAAFAACTSPKAYASLADGIHTFQVTATDLAGNEDATPATHTWTVTTSSGTPTPTSTPTPTPTPTPMPTSTASGTPTPAATASPTATPTDTTAPVITIVKVVKKRRTKVVFRASEPATFTCALDRNPPKACRPPFKTKVKRGRHRIVIKAVDAAGNRSKAAVVRLRVR